MTLKELILDYRKAHDLSQRQFATKCGVSNGYISMLEKGVNPNTKEPIIPALPTLKKLADGMDMLVNELIAMAEDMPVDLRESDEEELSNGDDIYSEKEIDLIRAYRKASPDDRQIVDLTLKKYLIQPCSTEAPTKAS